eukprot:jgi/Phyca11/117579/e_gw1.33.147.1
MARAQRLVLACEHRKARLKKQVLLILRLRCMYSFDRNVLTVAALIDPAKSPWHTLYASRDCGSFISVVSLDPEAFDCLLQVFSVHYVVKSGVGKPGRPPKFIFKHAVLACILHFYTAAVENKTLCELFGVPPATLSRVLANAEAALCASLKVLPDASIRFPSKEQQVDWARLTQAREPLLQGIWGFVDGKNYRVQEPTNADLQNAHYNGTYNVYLFANWC